MQSFVFLAVYAAIVTAAELYSPWALRILAGIALLATALDRWRARPSYGRARGLPPGYAYKPDWEVTPREVKGMLDRGDKFYFVDCRLPNEYAITHIEGARLIPLQQINQRYDELKGHEAEKVIVHCKSGMRSAKAIDFLRQQGFTKLKNLKGGILAWADRIDPKMPKY